MKPKAEPRVSRWKARREVDKEIAQPGGGKEAVHVTEQYLVTAYKLCFIAISVMVLWGHAKGSKMCLTYLFLS